MKTRLLTVIFLMATNSFAQTATTHDKPTVYLNGTGNSQTTAGRGAFGTAWATSSQHDQTIELAKDFGECQGVVVTLKSDNADYNVMLNHEGNNHNQMLLTNTAGEVLLTDTKNGLHQSVKNKSEKFCAAILNDWSKGHQQASAKQ
jgi:hypothetical protein